MPETVEGFGDVVVVRERHSEHGTPYLLVPTGEWTGDYPVVHGWRGPEKEEETISRQDVIEVLCSALKTTPLGFWECKDVSATEEVEEEILEKAKTVVEEHADIRLAEAHSYPHEGYVEEFVDPWIMASFGDATAINGEIVGEGRHRPPRGYEETDRGGAVPSEETELEVEFVAERVWEALDRKFPFMFVRSAVSREYAPSGGYFEWGGSGFVEVWAPPEGLRRRLLFEQRRRQERLRQNMEKTRRSRGRKEWKPGPPKKKESES